MFGGFAYIGKEYWLLVAAGTFVLLLIFAIAAELLTKKGKRNK